MIPVDFYFLHSGKLNHFYLIHKPDQLNYSYAISV